jgi:ABC-type sugar transport system substrate-binding protein
LNKQLEPRKPQIDAICCNQYEHTRRRKKMSGKSTKAVLILATLFILISIGLVACGQAQPTAAPAEGEETTTEGSTEESLSVCVIVPTTEIEYFATLLKEYVKAGETRNIEVITVDSANDPQKEANAIENCLAKGVDGIVASVIDPVTGKASAEMVMAEGIPFILQGQEPVDADWASGNVGYSEADMGRYAGEMLSVCLMEKYPDADTFTVGACGWPQWPSCVRRIDASIAAVEKETGKNIVWAFNQECGTREKGDAATSTALQKYPEMVAVVSINDGGSMGALAAFEAAGVPVEDICIAGANNDLEVRQYIKDGRIYGTVDLNHAGLANAALDLVLKARQGEEIPPMTYVDMIKVTKENVDQWPTDKQ